MKTRFAPSPTGFIHIGNARTALFAALLAHSQSDGCFLLRIEDTDLKRSEVKYEQQLQQDLHWLGINWDEGVAVGGEHTPYRQSERLCIYEQYYNQLLAADLAFECYKTDQELAHMRKVQRVSGQAPRYPRTWRNQSAQEIYDKKAQGVQPALRFKVPDNTNIAFDDFVKGSQNFASDDIGDFVIRKADGSPSFMFSNAVDDSLMAVSHVMRGEDHLTNTPRQLMILDALGLRRPSYGHISLITGSDGAPLSKRNGSRSIGDLRESGFLPLAVVNYLARLGHYYQHNDLYPLAELAAHFSISSLGKAKARFDADQLLYWQKSAISGADNPSLWQWLGSCVHNLVPASQSELFINTIRDNILFPQEGLHWAQLLFTDEFQLETDQQTVVANAGTEFFQLACEAVREHGADFNAVSSVLKAELGVKGKSLFQPLRVALTGQMHGPKLGGLMELLGWQRCGQRLQQASLHCG